MGLYIRQKSMCHGFRVSGYGFRNVNPRFVVKKNGFGRILISRKEAPGVWGKGKTFFSEQLTMNSYQ